MLPNTLTSITRVRKSVLSERVDILVENNEVLFVALSGNTTHRLSTQSVNAVKELVLKGEGHAVLEGVYTHKSERSALRSQSVKITAYASQGYISFMIPISYYNGIKTYAYTFALAGSISNVFPSNKSKIRANIRSMIQPSNIR